MADWSINAIRKERSDQDLLTGIDFASHLWMEKEIKSVANVTREDVSAFLRVAVEAGIRPEYQEYDLEDANEPCWRSSRVEYAAPKSCG